MTSLVGRLLPLGERSFGKYDLIAKLATGGMAEIFLAKRKEVSRGEDEFVVIKRVLPHLAEEERFLSMFRDEARLASRLVHENVCRVYEAGSVSGTFFMAMEYLHGVPVSRLLLRAARDRLPTDLRMITAIICQVCDGLQHAHDLQSYDGRPLEVVHRDVSPPNIYVTADGITKLLDFGVAKARGASQQTRTGTVKGKSSYMSPEQIHGKELDRRSDVFSLGVVLWESIAARRLFARDTDFLTYKAITDDPIPLVTDSRPAVPPEVAQAVARALTRERDERTPSAEKLADEVRQAMAPHGGVATRDELAAYIHYAFARDLEGRQALFESVKDHLRVNSNAEIRIVIDEIDEEDLEDGVAIGDAQLQSIGPMRPVAPEPLPSAAVSPTAAGAPLAAASAQDFEATDVGPRRGSRSRTALVVAALAIVGLAAAMFFARGGDEASGAAPPADAAAAAATAASPPVGTQPDLGAVLADAATADLTDLPPPAAPLRADASPAAALPRTDASTADAAPAREPVDSRPGFLSIDSAPYATIYVDGKKIGVTPLFKVELAPGAHKLKAVSATGETRRQRIRIRPARTTNLGRLTWK